MVNAKSEGVTNAELQKVIKTEETCDKNETFQR